MCNQQNTETPEGRLEGLGGVAMASWRRNLGFDQEKKAGSQGTGFAPGGFVARRTLGAKTMRLLPTSTGRYAVGDGTQ